MRRGFELVCVVALTAGILIGSAAGQNALPPAGNALVIATQDNAALPLPSADRDAGIVASALARKNYNVLGARNLDQASLKAAIAEFETRIKASPSAPIFIYFSGPTLQVAQDNYILASNSTYTDIKTDAISLNVLTSELARLTSGPKWIVIDGARLPQPVSIPANLSTGLALPETAPNTVIMLNTTPGLTILEPTGSVNAFATAWYEAIGNGALSSQDLVDLVILRSFDMSKGKQVPWAIGKHEKSESVFTPVAGTAMNFGPLRSTLMSELSPAQGFAAALLRRSIATYEEYILVQIQNPMTQIARTLLASLREATIWREAAIRPSASSLWAYLKLYPRGLHAAEARSMLVQLGQAPTPPQDAPLLAIITNAPTANESALLAQIIPYRLDDATLELTNVAAAIRPLVPDLSAQAQTPVTPVPSNSYFGLPLPQIDEAALARIQLPSQLPPPPAPPTPPEPKLIKKSAKPAIPVPPQRKSDEDSAEQAPLITITIPIFGTATPNTPPAANDAPAQTPAPAPAPQPTPKPLAPKTSTKKLPGDVFEQTFDSAPAQQALPY